MTHPIYPPEYDSAELCHICLEMPDFCRCPACPVCGTCGDPNCYKNQHGMEHPAPAELVRVMILQPVPAEIYQGPVVLDLLADVLPARVAWYLDNLLREFAAVVPYNVSGWDAFVMQAGPHAGTWERCQVCHHVVPIHGLPHGPCHMVVAQGTRLELAGTTWRVIGIMGGGKLGVGEAIVLAENENGDQGSLVFKVRPGPPRRPTDVAQEPPMARCKYCSLMVPATHECDEESIVAYAKSSSTRWWG